MKCQIQFQERFFLKRYNIEKRFTQIEFLFFNNPVLLEETKFYFIYLYFIGEEFFRAEGCWCWKTSFGPNFGGDSN